MKKMMTALLFLSTILTIPAIAEVNMPGAPDFSVKSTSSIPSNNYKKSVDYTQTNIPRPNLPQTNISQSNENSSASRAARKLIKALLYNQDPTAAGEELKKHINGGYSYQTLGGRNCPYVKKHGSVSINVNGKKYSGKICATVTYTNNGVEKKIGECAY